MSEAHERKLRSKEIGDYVSVHFGLVRAEEPLPVDLHLYFSLSSHLMIWKSEGEFLSKDFIDRYLRRGIEQVWIHKDDETQWNVYIVPPDDLFAAATPASELKSESAAEVTVPVEGKAVSPRAARTQEGALIAAALTSPALDHDQRKAIVQEAARAVLRDLTTPETTAAQAEADHKAWLTIQDVLDAIAEQTESAVADTWKLARIDPDLEHSVNVATYAVIFAMAFGKIESDLISDLALAGLLHDLGVSQVPASLVAIPWKQMRNDQTFPYSQHVQFGVEILKAHAPALNTRIQAVIHQHHEKFDGTGYPQQLGGFKIDDVTQLVSMADLLHAMSSGHWDGEERPLKESFETLEKLEKARTFPEFFNPDVYTSVIRWIRHAANNDLSVKASDVVLKQIQGVMEKPR